jgi:uncharacterized protein DUF4058
MDNPFPGMNPYLERRWGDVHTALAVYLRDSLNEQLPGDLEAHVEESLSVEFREGRPRTIYPDVGVIERPPELNWGPESDSSVAVAEPCVVSISDDPRTLRHIEIIDRNSGNRLVTTIELPSPANKTNKEGRRAYFQKRAEYFDAWVNIVEIDLTREGKFVLAIDRRFLPQNCRTPYLICVRRVTRPNEAELYPIPLANPLPNIRIPLRPTDRDVVLQLQPLLNDCYRKGRYASIDYSVLLDPPLDLADAAWSDELLRSKGLKP